MTVIEAFSQMPQVEEEIDILDCLKDYEAMLRTLSKKRGFPKQELAALAKADRVRQLIERLESLEGVN